MNGITGAILSARLFGLLLASILLSATGCSAIEQHQRLGSETAAAQAASTSATVDATARAMARAEFQATAQALSAHATDAAATLSALAATATTAPPADAALPPPASAETVEYGAVPIDSDGLNIIAALAFDADGQLLAATRAGQIYALPDHDGDGSADETRLIFADEAQRLGQVAGMIVQGDALILLNGGRLSALTDSDGDGMYDTVTPLAEGLPAEQSPLQASNGIAQAPDGRLFTADINTGEVLQISLSE